jgi:hypothetical protein
MALVVGGAAAAELLADDPRFEGRRRPLLQGIGGLDVVMRVDQDGGQPRVHQPLRVDGGVTGRLDQLRGGEARIPGRLGELLGAAPDVAGMSGVGRDRGDTAEFDQFIDEARLVGVAVGVEVLSVHGRGA